MFDVTCPYCNKDFNVVTDDGKHCEDASYEEDQCPHCQSQVMIRTHVIYSYDVEKADCLNIDEPSDEHHQWSSRIRLVKDQSRTKKESYKFCRACGTEVLGAQ